MTLSKYSVNGILFDVPEGVTHFKFIPSTQCRISTLKDIIVFEYTKGITAGEFSRLASLESVYPDSVLISYLVPTEIKFTNFDVNRDNEFIKICHEDINLTQLKYKIPEDNLINNYYNLIYLIGTLGEFNLDEYYDKLVSTKLLVVNNKVGSASEVGNVEIHNSRVNKIKSNRVYLPLSKYRQYRISSLDYITDFFEKMSALFEEYGFELVEYQKLKDASTHNIVTFKIGTHGKEFMKRIHPRIPEHNLMFSGSRIQFILSTPETDIYEDFRMRYNNIDFIQNNREFFCEDKYGVKWRYDCVWQASVDDSFAHEFSTTELGTHGYSFPFTATLEFFDVYDVHYSLIETIIQKYNESGPKGEVPQKYEHET